MTPNIASVISSASNANGSASAFLFAAASEPEAAFSAPFPEAYARRTTTERQSQTIQIDPPPHTLLSPPPRAHESPVSRRASRRIRIRVPPARARAFASISHLCRLPPARGCAYIDATRSHVVSLLTHRALASTPRARASHHPSPTTASSHRVHRLRARAQSRVIVHSRLPARRSPRSHRENIHTHHPSNSRAVPTPYASSRAS